MKKKQVEKESAWGGGINPKSSMSYEKYLKSGLEIIHKNLSIRVYKLAPKDIYPAFDRGRDLRVGFFWKGKPVVDSTTKESRNYEFVLEQSFWYQSSKSKEDRQYMRDHADSHLTAINNAVQAGRDKYIAETAKKTKVSKPRKPRKTKVSVGNTQDLLENFKKK